MNDPSLVQLLALQYRWGQWVQGMTLHRGGQEVIPFRAFKFISVLHFPASSALPAREKKKSSAGVMGRGGSSNHMHTWQEGRCRANGNGWPNTSSTRNKSSLDRHISDTKDNYVDKKKEPASHAANRDWCEEQPSTFVRGRGIAEKEVKNGISTEQWATLGERAQNNYPLRCCHGDTIGDRQGNELINGCHIHNDRKWVAFKERSEIVLNPMALHFHSLLPEEPQGHTDIHFCNHSYRWRRGN